MSTALLRQLPAIDKWLASESGAALCAEFSRPEVLAVMRAHLARIRRDVGNGATELPSFESLEYTELLRADLIARRQHSLERTINATGIVVHTNLGRAPLAPQAIAAIERVAESYSNLEFDLETGNRGSRQTHVETLLTELTGAEAALVVNNCAAALMLVLHAFANRREVVISRGELIEIGGSFRMPDVIAESGAIMAEVGTTNRTSLADYESAVTDETRILLASHPSNYRVVGFTAKPTLAELANLAAKRRLVFVQDLGSGSLIDIAAPGFEREPTVADSIAEDVDLVTFSGDKLLGGPQAGIVVGRAKLIETIKRRPMARALRIDKLSLAALEATLRLYAPPHDPMAEVPVLRMIGESKASVATRSKRFTEALSGQPGLRAEIADGVSFAGGGALPMSEIPTKVVRLAVDNVSATELARRLRARDPAVIGRIADDALTLDLRTVPPEETGELIAAIAELLA